jgi:hypothetical protein
MTTYRYLDELFTAIGEHMPDSNEILLDAGTVRREIWERYRKDMKRYGMQSYSYARFTNVSATEFPRVKIRVYKGVGGKCFTCFLVHQKQLEFSDPIRISLCSKLAALHRSGYMGERMGYYANQALSMQFPGDFMSLIFDGMDQNHCRIPWCGNKYQFGAYLPHHIQGCLQHGCSVALYETFANVRNGTNLSITCLLKEIARRAAANNGTLPDVLFVQMDGGPENRNKTMLAFAAFLVSRRVFRKVVLTRLPVGHTHEDIDAVFSLIWTALMAKYCLTPSAFAEKIYESGTPSMNLTLILSNMSFTVIYFYTCFSERQRKRTKR